MRRLFLPAISLVLVIAAVFAIPVRAESDLEQQVEQLWTEVEALKTEVAQLKTQLEQLSKPATQPEAFIPIQPPQGAPGYSRLNPAPIGSTLTITVDRLTEQFTAEVTLVEIVRGAKAWAMIKQANPINRPPKDGHEYLLAKIRFKLIAMLDPEAKLSLSPVAFTAVSADGVEYETPLIVPPTPGIQADLYQGGQHEGWAAFEVRIGDNPLITYGRDYMGKGGIWFKTTE